MHDDAPTSASFESVWDQAITNDGEVGRMSNQHVEDPPNLSGNSKIFQTVRRGGKTGKVSSALKSIQFASRGRPDGSTAIEPAGAHDGSSKCTVNRTRNEAPSQPKPMSAADGSSPMLAPCGSTEAWNEWLKLIHHEVF